MQKHETNKPTSVRAMSLIRLLINTLHAYTMKNMENKYWFADTSQNISSQLLQVDCYDLNTDEKVATIELKYSYDEASEEWTVEHSEFHTNPTIKEITELTEELLNRASNEFHDFCYQCSMYDAYDDEEWWCV